MSASVDAYGHLVAVSQDHPARDRDAARPPPLPQSWRHDLAAVRRRLSARNAAALGPLPAPPRRLSARSTGSGVVLADQALGWVVALAGDLAPTARVTLPASRATVSAPLPVAGW